MGLQKNVASQKIRVFAFNSTTNAPVTGDAANITCKIGIDWAALAAVTDTNPTEAEDGYYLFDLTQAETNGNVLDFYPDSSTADVVVIAVPGTVYTVPPNFASAALATAAALDTIDDFLDTEIAAILAAVDTEVASILTDTAEIGAAGAGLSAIPWNASWDAEVQSEVADGLNAYDPPTRAELTSDINSVLAYLDGLVIAKGTIGATGNSTTALHLTGLTYGDDEINNYLLAVKDVSTGEWHARYIEDWADTGDLATVATLPFTPENSVDLYVILAFRQDVTGGSGLDAAGVRAALGFASASYDTDISGLNTKLDTIDDFLDTEIAAILVAVDTEVATILTDTNELQADWTNGGRLDLLLDATLADTNELQTDWANGGRLDLILDARASQASVDTIDDFLDTEVAAILAAVDTEVAAILVDTGTDIPATLASLLTTALTEGYRSTGATGSVRDLLYEILANLVEFANSGTTRTAKKLDGSTTAKVYTYDDADNPTSITEST